MKNLHLIPTDKPSRLYIGDNGNFVLGLIKNSIQSRNDYFTNQHIYITNDEEIKEGEWLIVNDEDVMQMKSSYDNDMSGEDICKKIILTTNTDLIQDSVQAIDDEFLEWFVKNPSCEEVMTIKNYLSNNGQWKDVLLPSEWEIDTKIKYKITYALSEPLPETLEEVAEKEYDDNLYGYEKYRYGFIEGVKWQAERMYNEEEVRNLFKKYQYDLAQWVLRMEDDIDNKLIPVEWFEQNKKK